MHSVDTEYGALAVDERIIEEITKADRVLTENRRTPIPATKEEAAKYALGVLAETISWMRGTAVPSPCLGVWYGYQGEVGTMIRFRLELSKRRIVFSGISRQR